MKTTKLEKLTSCLYALRWASKQKNQKQAWKICERGDWMLWLIGRLSGEPESQKCKKLALATCECARLSLKYIPEGENRPLISIETVEKWAKGKATIEEVRVAADAAYDASAVADSAAAFASAAAYAVADAYTAASAISPYADSPYAQSKILKQCADIVREHYPNPPKL